MARAKIGVGDVDWASVSTGALGGGLAAATVVTLLPQVQGIDPLVACITTGLGLAAAACGLRRAKAPAGDLHPPTGTLGRHAKGEEALMVRLSKTPVVERDKAVRKELRRQLDPRRTDDPIVDVLLEVLAFHEARGRLRSKERGRSSDDAHDVLRDLAAVMAGEGAPEDKARAFLDGFKQRICDGKARRVPRIGEGLEDHAMRQTVLMEALHRARRVGGAVTVAQLGWLGTADPSLWNAIDGLDGRACRPDGLGAQLHWQAERAAGEALREPQVEAGIRPVLDLLGNPAVRGAA